MNAMIRMFRTIAKYLSSNGGNRQSNPLVLLSASIPIEKFCNAVYLSFYLAYRLNN